MARYKAPEALANVFGFLEWFLVRAFLVVVLAFELWECLTYLISRAH
jgi:hypothetical protein